MAPRIPKEIDVEIFELLNKSLQSGDSIPDIQLQGLIRQAKKARIPQRYACLSALYSHSFNYSLVVENALNSIKYGYNDIFCVENALSALSNNMLLSETVNISKDYPLSLKHEVSRHLIYEAAIYTLDLEYCEYITSNYELNFEEDHCDYRLLKEYFESDSNLIKKASEYFTYSLKGLAGLFKKHKIHNKSFGFGLVDDPTEPYLEFRLFPYNTTVDTMIDLELDWHSYIAKFDVTEKQLCNISFQVREVE